MGSSKFVTQYPFPANMVAFMLIMLKGLCRCFWVVAVGVGLGVVAAAERFELLTASKRISALVNCLVASIFTCLKFRKKSKIAIMQSKLHGRLCLPWRPRPLQPIFINGRFLRGGNAGVHNLGVLDKLKSRKKEGVHFAQVVAGIFPENREIRT